MANFTTHIAVGTVVAGGLATLTLAADVVAPENLVAVTMAGVLGSVLPDIDLKDSRASKTMFAGLGIFFSFAALFNAATKFSIAELWIIWLGTLVLVRYGLHYVFHRTSVHRGIWHSLIAGVFSSVATALVFFYVLQKPEGVAWLAAGFMMVGYITHLVLDEMYSVDVMDTRIKASFGTALKIFDRRYPAASVAMAAATAAAIYVAPPTKMFVDGVRTDGLWSGLHHRMLPKDKWFGVIATHRSTSAKRAGEGLDAVTTGSIATTKPGAPQAKPVAVPSQPAAPSQSAPAQAVPTEATPVQPAPELAH